LPSGSGIANAVLGELELELELELENDLNDVHRSRVLRIK